MTVVQGGEEGEKRLHRIMSRMYNVLLDHRDQPAVVRNHDRRDLDAKTLCHVSIKFRSLVLMATKYIHKKLD
jgi:hypothetical protein